MGFSEADLMNMQSRLNKNRKQNPDTEADEEERESRLHEKIIAYCEGQWPRWKYIRARMDKKSTLAKGCQDFTIFAPGKVLCIECKARNEKPSKDQLIWHKEMEMNGYKVHVVRSYEEFLNLL